MNAEYTIRKAVSEDEQTIRELFREMLRTINHTDIVEGYEGGYLDKFWMDGEDRIYVAEENEVHAHLSVEVYREPQMYVYLDDCSVTASHRNMGIGSALIRTAENYAGELKIPVIIFHVKKTNGEAFRLYERLGYSICRDDGDRYLMQKEITQWGDC